MSLRTVRVELGARAYDIRIGPGAIDHAPAWADAVRGRHALVVTNPVVVRHYGARVLAALGAREARLHEVPEGEAHKTLAEAGRVFAALASLHVELYHGKCGLKISSTKSHGSDMVSIDVLLNAHDGRCI